MFYIHCSKCSECSTEGVRVSPLAHTLKVKPSEMYVKRHATPSMIYNKPDWPVRTLGLTKEKWSNNVSLRVKFNSEAFLQCTFKTKFCFYATLT